jgi:hypothetical protein
MAISRCSMRFCLSPSTAALRHAADQVARTAQALWQLGARSHADEALEPGRRARAGLRALAARAKSSASRSKRCRSTARSSKVHPDGTGAFKKRGAGGHRAFARRMERQNPSGCRECAVRRGLRPLARPEAGDAPCGRQWLRAWGRANARRVVRSWIAPARVTRRANSLSAWASPGRAAPHPGRLAPAGL